MIFLTKTYAFEVVGNPLGGLRVVEGALLEVSGAIRGDFWWSCGEDGPETGAR